MIRTKTGAWVISSTGEYFDGNEYPTKEAAENAGAIEYAGDCFHIGEVESLMFEKSDLRSISDEIQDMLCDSLYNIVGDACAIWKPTKKQCDDLDKMIADAIIDWVNKHNLHPKCFHVDNIEIIGGK